MEQTLNIHYHKTRLIKIAIERYPTYLEAAKTLGIEVRTLWRYRREGKLL